MQIIISVSSYTVDMLHNTQNYNLFFLLLYPCHSYSLSLPLFLNTLTSHIHDHHNLNKNLTSQYNEDAFLNFTGLTKKYGYPTEVHTVVTEDGYILTMFRLTGKRCSRGATKPIPVIMKHGLVDSSDTFIVAGPGVGLAYVLADACYDVWCPNNRGNHHSRRHITLNPDSDPQYWNFTFNEHGLLDLPAVVDYVLDKTRAEKVNYIGHSQGTTDFLVLASTRPEYNAKFNLAICMGPVAWSSNMFSPFFKNLAKINEEVERALESAGVNELLGRGQQHIIRSVCQIAPDACGFILFILSGLNPQNIRRETMMAVFGHYPSSTSVKNVAHFARAITVDKFRRFDYGERMNLAVYGSCEPPEYEVSRVSTPVALLYGRRDWFVSEKDVVTLTSTLPNVVDSYLMPAEDWSHADFVWGKGIPSQLAPKVFEYLNKI